ncbi:MAG: flippase-like domain-containing protein [Chloroflexi bacterium]|nr:flippase-like domain-containing protein [Chloroflexota bacterium]
MNQDTRTAKNKRIWHNIVTLIILGLGVFLVLPQIGVLENSWQVLSSMSPWAVVLAFIAQVLSYLGSGYLLQSSLALSHLSVSLAHSTLIVLGASSIGLVAGGTVGNSAAIFRWTHCEGENVGERTLTTLLPSLFNSLVLVLFSIVGLIYLVVTHNMTVFQIVAFSIALGILGLGILVIVLARRYRDRTLQICLQIGKFWTNLRHEPFNPDSVEQWLDEIYLDLEVLVQGRWHLLALGAFISVSFDILTLYLLFIAAGNKISLGVLLAGYALPLLLGRIAFILPGGVGVVESSMALLYTGLGIPKAEAAVVILGYRLISFWIPNLIGFPVTIYLQNRTPFTLNPRTRA